MAAMDPKVIWAAIQRAKKSRKATKVVACTLDHEVGWRLQQLASMMGVGPGAVVEVLIRDTVMAVRLPYDSYGRVSIAHTSASEGAMESGDGQEKGPVETLSMGESLTSPGDRERGPSPGEGEGRDASPAPAVSKRKRA